MVDTQQTADTPKAILFQIEPDGLLSKRGGIGIGARAFGVAMAAVAAKIALPAIHSLAISDLTMLTATGRADKGFGELILHNMLLYHRFLVTAPVSSPLTVKMRYVIIAALAESRFQPCL